MAGKIPTKRSIKLSKSRNASKDQMSISKYFISDSSYPTSSLRKRNAIAEAKDQKLLPVKKLQKLHQTVDELCDLETCNISEATTEHLQSFTFQKNLEKGKSTNKYSFIESSSSSTPLSCHSDAPCIPIPLKSEINLQTTEITLSETELQVSTTNTNPKYTPLEKQYLEFRKEYPDAILLIECGYKYKLFEKDAEITSKMFNIAYFKTHNFMSSRILSSRLYFYVKQLVLKGFKVAVIKQSESAALKAAGETRNELFTRKLDALYTKSTLIGEEFLTPDSEELLDTSTTVDVDMSSGYLMCIYEEPLSSSNQRTNIAFVAVQVSSGDLTFASFEDVSIRNRLETYLIHINPAEILLPSNLSKETDRVISAFSLDRFVRTEKMSQTAFENSDAFTSVSEFYESMSLQADSHDLQHIKQIILSLPAFVTSCLSALIQYLSKFKLESVLKNLKNMKPLSTNEHMILTSTTLNGLEILRNNYNYAEYGSLFWVLNRTLTKFGERLLKFWITKPLKDMITIEERLNILTEITHSDSLVFKVVECILSKLPDLEKILCSVFHHKCSCYDFLKLLQAFTKIRMEMLSIADKISIEIEVPRLKIILTDLPYLLENVEKFSSNINPEAAREGNKTSVFHDISMYPELKKCQEEISTAEQKLNDLRPEICKTLKLINFKYSAVAGQKYLIEVPNSHLRLVPDCWHKISSTKHVSRFKSQQVIELCNEIEQKKELMIGYANEAWLTFLNDFGTSFYKHKRAISHLAELDCYFSLAKVAKEENYCRPHIVDSEEQAFHVQQGRHPIITKVMGEEKQFVANDIIMDSKNKCIIVTGPNMGGKSTYVRETAIIAIMAQIGSYVPADCAKLPLFDSIYVRMGADDALAHEKSTFMTEMSETSEILQNATSKSLVILDELGRGTSTNDGTAIAYATLEYLISELRCFSMFVTHYPAIVELKNLYPSSITTVHMGYILKDNADDCDIETVTFLYNAVTGVNKKSYGINVAALAGIPRDILLEAQQKSKEVELKTHIQKKLRNLITKLKSAFGDS